MPNPPGQSPPRLFGSDLDMVARLSSPAQMSLASCLGVARSDVAKVMRLIVGWITGQIMQGSGYGSLWAVGITDAIVGLGFAGQGAMIHIRHRDRICCGNVRLVKKG